MKVNRVSSIIAACSTLLVVVITIFFFKLQDSSRFDIVLIIVDSLPGFLTGKYLSIGGDYAFFDNILDKKFTTLAEYLKKSGYYTAAFISNAHLRAGKGFEQGFD